MKATGIVRPVDNLGRIVIPVELRMALDINRGDSLEIFVENSNIVLRKYEPACIFCGSLDEVRVFKGKNICGDCSKEIGCWN